MFKKVIVFISLLLFLVCVSGCGMSKEEKKQDLHGNLLGLHTLLGLSLRNDYEAYVADYQTSNDQNRTDIERLTLMLERAQLILSDIQKFQKSINKDSLKLESGNDADRKNDFEQLKSKYIEFAKQLEEATQFKIGILKKSKDGKDFTPEEKKKIMEVIEKTDKQLMEKNTDCNKSFNNIMDKYNIVFQKY